MASRIGSSGWLGPAIGQETRQIFATALVDYDCDGDCCDDSNCDDSGGGGGNGGGADGDGGGGGGGSHDGCSGDSGDGGEIENWRRQEQWWKKERERVLHTEEGV